jgi:hypothetical protein
MQRYRLSMRTSDGALDSEWVARIRICAAAFAARRRAPAPLAACWIGVDRQIEGVAMKRRALLAASILLLAIGRARPVGAQTDKPKFKPEELDQMLAPVALYPDALLSQILMAAGYPLEVVDAARWSKANPTLKGDAAVTAVKDKEWDVSVKSLVAFPDVLSQMNEHLDWTQKLGDAMIGQQADVADSIQRLRAMASASGNLKNTPQQTVTTQGSGDNVQYLIEPADPQVIYVPSYNPSWAYGSWPYPAYPPVWYPLGGALLQGMFWGIGFAAAGAMFGSWNWGGRGNSYANVNVNRAVNIDRNFDRNRIDRDGKWQHRPEHRKGVGYRDAATRQQFGQQRPGAAQRNEFRGRPEGGQRPGGAPGGGVQRPGGGPGAGQRPGGGPGAGQRPGGGGAVQRPGGGVQQRPAQGVGNQRPGALNGANRGQQVNREAARGRQQMNRAGAHGGGGGRPGGGGGRPSGGGGGRPGGGGGGRPSGGGGGRPGGGGGGRR